MCEIDEKYKCNTEVNVLGNYIKIKYNCDNYYAEFIWKDAMHMLRNNNYKSSSYNYIDKTVTIFFHNMIL